MMVIIWSECFCILKKVFDTVDHRILLKKKLCMVSEAIIKMVWKLLNEHYINMLPIVDQWCTVKNRTYHLRSTTWIYTWHTVIYYLHEWYMQCVTSLHNLICRWYKCSSKWQVIWNTKGWIVYTLSLNINITYYILFHRARNLWIHICHRARNLWIHICHRARNLWIHIKYYEQLYTNINWMLPIPWCYFR